jgi:hypothetical protein
MTRKVIISFDIAWDKLVEAKQTLFPVWGDGEERKPRKGKPMNSYTLRATKSVNMHPFPFLSIKNDDGTPYKEEEIVAVTVVSAEDKLPPPPGKIRKLINFIAHVYKDHVPVVEYLLYVNQSQDINYFKLDRIKRK